MYFGLPGGEDERGNRIGREHRWGKGHEREIRHRGGAIQQGIVEEVRPHAADNQPPAFLAQAIATGQRIYIIGVALTLTTVGAELGTILSAPS